MKNTLRIKKLKEARSRLLEVHTQVNYAFRDDDEYRSALKNDLFKSIDIIRDEFEYLQKPLWKRLLNR